jgi:hypothetical protein
MYCRHLRYCGHAGTDCGYCKYAKYCACTASTSGTASTPQVLQKGPIPCETARLDPFGAISDQLAWSFWPLWGSVCLNQLGHCFQPLPLVDNTSLYDKVLVCTTTYSSVLQSTSLCYKVLVCISLYYKVLVCTTRY